MEELSKEVQKALRPFLKIDSHGLKAVVLSSFASRILVHPQLESWGFRSLGIKFKMEKKCQFFEVRKDESQNV